MDDKFSHLPGPIADHNRAWEADAIEKCRSDPWFKDNNFCPVCVMALPHCLCEYQRIARKMLREFEDNENLWKPTWWGREPTRTLGCSYEPKMELMMKLLSAAVKELKIKTGVHPA